MKILDKIAKLIDVKSIISLIVTIVFAILAIRGDIEVDNIMTVVILVFQFFFNYQNSKKKEDGEVND